MAAGQRRGGVREPRGRERAGLGAMPGAGPLAPALPVRGRSGPGPHGDPPRTPTARTHGETSNTPCLFPASQLNYNSQRAPRGPATHTGRRRAARHAGTCSPVPPSRRPPPPHRPAAPLPPVPQRRPGQRAVLADAHVLAHGHDGVERAHHALTPSPRHRHRHSRGRARGGRSEGAASGGGRCGRDPGPG